MATFDHAAAYQAIVEAMVELFELDASQITPESRFFEDLDLDSIDAIDLLARLRELTGTRPDPDVIKDIHTVEDVVVLLRTLSAPAG